jgi:hypothetical protein
MNGIKHSGVLRTSTPPGYTYSIRVNPSDPKKFIHINGWDKLLVPLCLLGMMTTALFFEQHSLNDLLSVFL